MADDERPPEETPWGSERDEPDKFFGGFWWIYTSRHGGLYLTEKQQQAIPESLKAHSKDGTGVWWEENTAWSLPVFYLLSKRPEASLSEEEQENIFQAEETARNEYPDEWEHLTGRKLEPGQSHSRDTNWGPSPWTLDWKEALAKETEADARDPLDRLIEEQDRLARDREEPIRAERPKERDRER